MKKLLAIFLCVAMMLSMLVACKDNGNNEEGTTDATKTDTPNTQPDVKVDPLLVENLADYTIIYPETGMSADLNDEIRELRTAIKEKFDVFLDMKSDFINKKNPIREREILISKTNRPESAEVYAKAPRVDDYAVQIVGEKLVIVASTDEMLTQILRSVVNKIKALDAESTAFFLPEMQVLIAEEYAIEAVTIDGRDLSGYTIVCANSNSAISMANQLRDLIREKYQYTLAITVDQYVDAPQNAILFGKTKFSLPESVSGLESDQYYIGASGGNLYVYATDATVLYKAMYKIASQTPDAQTNRVSLDLPDLIEKPESTAVTAMSFNLWVSSVTDERAKHVVERINLVSPDTLGVQEASSNWVNRLKTALGSEYGYVGMGRDPGGGGEHSGIFYKKATLKVIESGTKWMSDTPDVPSKYSGSTCYRVFSYALFERISDGERFVHVNAHTEHTSDAICLMQLKVLVNFVKQNYADVPVLITGDLNARETNDSVRHVLNNGFDNAAKIAFKSSNASTFTPGASIIDFCLTSEEDFLVFEYAVDTYKYNNAEKDPSDHCPIYIKFELKS